jgi:radical SAM-linked protein
VKAQRLRFRYRITSEAADLGQRDLVAAWTDAISAAGLPLAHSGGKRGGALIQLAAPLPQGVTSDGELADVFLEELVDPAAALAGVCAAMRPGVEVTGVEEVGPGAASLQSLMRWAEYEVRVPADGLSAADVRKRIESLLHARSLPAEHHREKKTREYDLRPLVLDVRLEAVEDGAYRLGMRLRAEQELTARADQTALALGLPAPLHVHRRRLHLDDTPAVIRAYRAGGERFG